MIRISIPARSRESRVLPAPLRLMVQLIIIAALVSRVPPMSESVVWHVISSDVPVEM